MYPPATYTSASGGQCVTTTTIAAPPCSGTVDSSGNCVTSTKYQIHQNVPTATYTSASGGQCVTTTTIAAPPCSRVLLIVQETVLQVTNTPACPQGVPYSTSTGKCEVKPTVVCPPGYAFDVKESSKQKCKKNQITEYKNIATSSNIFF